MKFIYPAVFTPDGEGGYTAAFPDLEGCTAKGYNLDDAIEEANAAASDWISLELAEEDPQLPFVSELEEIPLLPGQVARNILVNIRFHVGWDE